MKKSMYIVGCYGNGSKEKLFVTDNKITAVGYVSRFNDMLTRWKDHYSKYEEVKYGSMRWIKDEYVQKHFDRWNDLQNITKAYYEEIELR